MKKTAVTLFELLIAMTLISVLGVIAISSLKLFLKDDTDLLKFKHVLGSVSEVVSRLNEDSTMYPTKIGFANASAGQYPEDSKIYSGPSKFRKLFKSNFNILEDRIKFDDKSVGEVPVYSFIPLGAGPDGVAKIVYADFSDLYCFKENKGVTYCLYDTCSEDIKLPNSCSNNNLSEIYIRAYLNNVDNTNENTFDNQHALYFTVERNGKISVPRVVGDASSPIINCYSKAYIDYVQCRVRENISEIEIHTSDKKRVHHSG